MTRKGIKLSIEASMRAKKATAGTESSPLETYLREIAETPLLNAKQEKELAHRIKTGDNEARDQMVRENMRLVVNIARSYTDKGLALQDLIEEGNLGLLRAVEGFDPEMNTRFSTYASYWIKQSIKRALLNTAKPIRIPAYMAEQLSKGRRATAKLTDERTKTSDNELVEADDLSHVRQLLDKMDQREATILRMRFGLDKDEPKTLKEIGECLALTRERVRQIESEALSKLADYLQCDLEGREGDRVRCNTPQLRQRKRGESGRKRGPIITEVSSDYLSSYRQFRAALAELLETQSGRWVAFTPKGRIGFADDDLTLHGICRQRGLLPGHYVIARIVPEQPTAEPSENWSAP